MTMKGGGQGRDTALRVSQKHAWRRGCVRCSYRAGAQEWNLERNDSVQKRLKGEGSGPSAVLGTGVGARSSWPATSPVHLSRFSKWDFLH